MEPFTTLTAIAAPYFRPDVETDEIIPHRFLRKPLAPGYGDFLFHDERFGADGRQKPDFVLHRAPYRGAQILVTGRNFGCGSSREGAVYALQYFGIRALVAPSYGEIFRANCMQNGLIPVVLPEDTVAVLSRELENNPGAMLTVDLPQQVVVDAAGARHAFEIDAPRKAQLIEGLDDIGVTLRLAADIQRFEQQYRARLPWLGTRQR